MLGVLGINVYIGLYDSSLQLVSPLHWDLNWLIAVIDLTAVVALLAKPGSTFWKSLAGIVWPIVYVANLFIDVETRLCLGMPASACSPTVSDAYQYLILGNSTDWVLWPYTIRLAIALAITALILSLLSLYLRAAKEKSSPN
jgi:hypothetical protein